MRVQSYANPYWNPLRNVMPEGFWIASGGPYATGACPGPWYRFDQIPESIHQSLPRRGPYVYMARCGTGFLSLSRNWYAFDGWTYNAFTEQWTRDYSTHPMKLTRSEADSQHLDLVESAGWGSTVNRMFLWNGAWVRLQ